MLWWWGSIISVSRLVWLSSVVRLALYDIIFFFFFQAEDGIRDGHVTGVQTCALPIWTRPIFAKACTNVAERAASTMSQASAMLAPAPAATPFTAATTGNGKLRSLRKIGRASCRERV